MRSLLFILLLGGSLWAREVNHTLNFPTELTNAYDFENLFEGLVFNQPVAVRTPPGQSSLYIVEKAGRIYYIENIDSPIKQLFLDIQPKVESRGEAGLLSIAFHPNFDINQTFYAFYIYKESDIIYQRVSKFLITEVSQDINTPYSFEETVLIQSLDQARNHNGGDMHFGQDGYLYISLGDEGGGNDRYNNSQVIDKDHYAGILRIDVDRRPENLEPNSHEAVILDQSGFAAYKIPVDNPWVGATSFNGSDVNPQEVITEFWAVGLRNPWRMSFDSLGQLWIGDVGQGKLEEVDIIPFGQGGMNFGWVYREGNVAGPKSGPDGLIFDEPIYVYARSGGDPNFEGRSITGGVVYEGSKIDSISGHYIFSDHLSGKVWALEKNGDQYEIAYLTEESRISAFGHHPVTGEVIICDYDSGLIKQLKASTGNEHEIPVSLSETGAFSDLSTLSPEAGVVGYEPNVTFWSDYAIKTRWFSLPELSKTFGFTNSGPWVYPEGSIWVKHFELEMERGNPSTKKRVETRFLVKTENEVYGLSYQWNDEGTEAHLVPDEGSDIDYTITIDGVATPKTWQIPSRSSCLECHTPGGGYALSFNTRQLNRENEIFGINQNILTALYDHGYLDRDPGDPSTHEKLAADDDVTASLETRVRSYFDMNCAYCHMQGGSTPAEFDMRFHISTDMMGLINAMPLDHGGDSERRLILPGEPEKSVLLSRISETQGFSRMPPIATNELDHRSIALVRNWIDDLGLSPVSSVSSNNRIAWFNFDSGVKDKDENLNLSLTGATIDSHEPKYGYGSLNLEGLDDHGSIETHPLLNSGGYITARTTSVWFKSSNIEGRQVILEEGGGTRGFNIYIDNGSLIVGAWDRALDFQDTDTWDGTWHQLGEIEVGQWYHVAFVLDAGEFPSQRSSHAFSAYLNGVKVATGEGMQVYNHNDMTIGKTLNGTRFYSQGYSEDGDFSGKIDDLALWNRALTDEEIATLSETTLQSIIGESGSIHVEQPNSSTWFRVDFQHQFNDPVVILGPATKNGGQAIAPRVRNVTPTGFEFQIDEWEYLDGYHLEERVSWLTIESGDHILQDGTRISAGKQEISLSFSKVSMTPFTSTPVVLSQVITTNDPKAVTTRQRNVKSYEFEMSLELEEAESSIFNEMVAWIAVSTDLTEIGEAGLTSDSVDDHWHSINYQTEQSSDTSIFANMQTTDGEDTATLRIQNPFSTGYEIQVQEEQSANSETAHTTEVIGYLTLRPGLIIK